MSKLPQSNRNAKIDPELKPRLNQTSSAQAEPTPATTSSTRQIPRNPWKIQRKTQTSHPQQTTSTTQSTTPSASTQSLTPSTQLPQSTQPAQRSQPSHSQHHTTPTHVRIIGIDPGSRQTGCAIIELQQNQPRLVHCSTLQAKQACFSDRIVSLHQQLQVIIEKYKPTEAAVESVFVKLNPQSAIILGQARGVLLLALAQQQIPIGEYAPRLVKQACCGYGAATKAQIQSMVQQLFKLATLPESDAADAVAIALCHSQQRRWQQACQSAQQDPG